jgi:hypothetical protein
VVQIYIEPHAIAFTDPGSLAAFVGLVEELLGAGSRRDRDARQRVVFGRPRTIGRLGVHDRYEFKCSWAS